ncbi:MAG: DEAD/DEAH box helicase, partial [Pseudomonadota bacterium]
MEYSEFLGKKMVGHKASGFKIETDVLNQMLFDWQKVSVRWALGQGKAALFESCGLGKTPQQLEWANQVFINTGKNVLILAPLAVAAQTVREGVKFGIEVNKCRTQADVKPGINITNYEMLGKFDCDSFIGVVLDESSILKSFMGKTKQFIIESFKKTPYKLCCTATPSPNDHMELLNHSDFLDLMPSPEALSRWFINDTMNFGTYRLKGHAAKDFWRWVSSWAVAINMPSDIGFENNGHVLPKLKTIKHFINYEDPHDIEKGLLFKETEILNASSLYRELRQTAGKRTDEAAELINNSSEMWIAWCNTNVEADLLKKKIPGAIDVRGSMPIEQKEEYLRLFCDSQARVMITKPSMCGFGLNLQHVHNMAFVGLSYSFEQRYQATRRCWRYGQKEQVNDHVILSPAEAQIFDAVLRKERKHEEMSTNMVAEFKEYQDLTEKREAVVMSVENKEYTGENWKIIQGDSVSEIKKLKKESVHLSIFSPPFSNLYIYSDALQDMGNSKNDDEFFNHFGYLIPEIYRITVPGRLCVVHCKDLVDYKSRDGRSGLRDFPGEIRIAFENHGWKYHSRVTIWKDPVLEMQRTKAQGLLHAQIKRDSSMSRQGLPDYLM